MKFESHKNTTLIAAICDDVKQKLECVAKMSDMLLLLITFIQHFLSALEQTHCTLVACDSK